MARQGGERLVHVERLFDVRELVFIGHRCELLGVRGGLTRAGTESVDAHPPGQLRDPGPDRLVLAQALEPLVDAREDLLEDVLCVVLREAEALDRDRVDVPREALDELAPSVAVTFATPRNEAGVAELCGQRSCAARSRFAMVSSSFQAIEAFPSTRGRNSHAVRP